MSHGPASEEMTPSLLPAPSRLPIAQLPISRLPMSATLRKFLGQVADDPARLGGRGIVLVG
jgi:hypothetical protein